MAYRLDKLQGNLARDRQSMLEFESIWLPYRNKLKIKSFTSRVIGWNWVGYWRSGVWLFLLSL